MSIITEFSNQYNNTLAPKNYYLADGLPVIHTKEPHLKKDDALKSIKVLEDARKYEETHNDRWKIQDPKVHGKPCDVAFLNALIALSDAEFAHFLAHLQHLRAVVREYTDPLDLGNWVDMMRGEGGSIKKHKKEKRRKPTKRRRPTKKRTIKRRR